MVVGLIFAGQVYLLKKPEREPVPVLEGAPAEGDQSQALEAVAEEPAKEAAKEAEPVAGVTEELVPEVEPAESDAATAQVSATHTPESQVQAPEEAEDPAPSQD